jgi:hypothetical protein
VLELLTFPVLTVSQGAVIAHSEPGTFSIASKHALKSGYFDEMWLVDSAGKGYEVRRYEPISVPFWKRPKGPFGRVVQLRNFELAETPKPSFDQIRTRVVACIEEHPELYEGVGETGEFVRMIRQASSLSELFSVFGARSKNNDS